MYQNCSIWSSNRPTRVQKFSKIRGIVSAKKKFSRTTHFSKRPGRSVRETYVKASYWNICYLDRVCAPDTETQTKPRKKRGTQRLLNFPRSCVKRKIPSATHQAGSINRTGSGPQFSLCQTTIHGTRKFPRRHSGVTGTTHNVSPKHASEYASWLTVQWSRQRHRQRNVN